MLELSPNLAFGYWRRGHALTFSGHPRVGLQDIHTSLRLDPRGSYLAHRLANAAIAFYFLRSYKDAVDAADEAVRAFPEFTPAYRFRAAALGQLNRAEEAAAALKKAMAIAPAAFDLLV